MKSWSTVITVTIKYILGPILAAVLGVGFATHTQDRAAKGYEVLAKALNDQVLARLNHLDQRLDGIESRLDKLEQRPASQPVNHHDDTRRAMKMAPRPAMVSTKVMAKAPPPPPAAKPAPHQLVPPRF